MPPVEIRRVSLADLPALVATLGQVRYFTDRLDRQEAGRGMLLVAFMGGRPVGDVYLWLEEAEVRRHLPGVPLLGHLEVLPKLQGRGIGTAIMMEAEGELRRRGHRLVALGVDTDNLRAAELYCRLGYIHWGHGLTETTREVDLSDGRIERLPDKCYVLVKKLTG